MMLVICIIVLLMVISMVDRSGLRPRYDQDLIVLDRYKDASHHAVFDDGRMRQPDVDVSVLELAH